MDTGMKKLHVLVHGFNSDRKSSEKTIGALDLADSTLFCYGHADLFDVRFASQNISECLASFIMALSADREVIPIAHSNGCQLVLRAAAIAPVFHRVVFLSPALDSDARFPPSIFEAHVFHTETDMAVEASRFVPFHPWGNMGRIGYRGSDGRVINHNRTSIVRGHSGWWDDIERTSAEIRSVLMEEE